MEPIIVYLIRRTMMMPSIASRLESELNRFLQQVLDRNAAALRTSYSIAVQRVSSTPTSARSLDVVIYLVADAAHSISDGFEGVDSHPSGHGGRTYQLPGNTTGSEIYVGTENGTMLAKVAFHEMLHYKTGWDNATLHSHSSGGITAASLQVDTAINDGNLELMGQHLGAQRTPYLL